MIVNTVQGFSAIPSTALFVMNYDTILNTYSQERVGGVETQTQEVVTKNRIHVNMINNFEWALVSGMLLANGNVYIGPGTLSPPELSTSTSTGKKTNKDKKTLKKISGFRNSKKL
jgi:hypothetical protein